MNEYDHEDAFADANRYAGRVTDLPGALKTCESKLQAQWLIADLQKQYERLFSAFIAGVEWGRNHPKEKK